MSETTTATGPQPGTAEYVDSLPQGSPERAAAARDLYNGREAKDGSALATERPTGVPEKFWDAKEGRINVDSLLTSYVALESRYGGAKPADPATATTPPAATTGDPAPTLAIAEGETDPAKAAVVAAGLDPEALAAKVRTAGALDDTDYAALEKAGIPKALATQYAQALKVAHDASVAKNTGDAVTRVGGQARLDAMLTWAAASLPAAEITQINGKLASAGWQDALDVLDARFTRANPVKAGEPSLVQGGAGTPSVQGYRSVAERTADIQNPKYRTDASFRDAVKQKMIVSRYDLDR